MRTGSRTHRTRTAVVVVLAVSLLGLVALAPASATDVPIGFRKAELTGEITDLPTSLQFGPDGRLYVADLFGAIQAYRIRRVTTARYEVQSVETITRVASIPNHNDDGSLAPDVQGRFITGLLVVGTAAHPVIYATSTDPRVGGDGVDTGLDTNGGTISRLRWTGTRWRKKTLVRGLPRSEEVHVTNGLQLDKSTNTLYVAQGGNTNMGAPSLAFGELPEYALSGAILSVDLDALGTLPYDLPTLNDPSRPGNPDAGDPFGGDDGDNQAKLVAGGPVQVYEPGFRNPYDLVLTRSGRMYATDNGPNAGAGGLPVGEGPDGACTNDVVEAGVTLEDSLHLVRGPGAYAGQPNPTRANATNTFGGHSPIVTANPVECDFLDPGPARGSLTTFPESTNGIVEYTATNFGGEMDGDLLLATYADNLIYRIELNAAGDAVLAKTPLVSNIGRRPLDVTAQGDADIYPGTVWVADHLGGKIFVFEPNDYGGGPPPNCTGADDPGLDEDGDGYTNADEIDNGTDPCSAGDVPPDWDGDLVSNLADPDDDNDGLLDTSDPFAVDETNGAATTVPVRRTWDAGAPTGGGLLDSGFSGLMTNGVDDYASLFDPGAITFGSATNTFQVDAATEGTARGASNDQEYAFQLGVRVDPATPKFRIQTRLAAPFAGVAGEAGQEMGIQFGTGGQDDYVQLVITGDGAVRAVREVAGARGPVASEPLGLVEPDFVDLTMTIDPAARTLRARFTTTEGAVTGPTVAVGTAISVPKSWLTAATEPAIGLISTSAGPGSEFAATWDWLKVVSAGGSAARSARPGRPSRSPLNSSLMEGTADTGSIGAPVTTAPAVAEGTDLGSWEVRRSPPGGARQEVAYTEVGGMLYLAWGANRLEPGAGTRHERYNPVRDRWKTLAPLPDDLSHVQTVEVGGKIYSIGGFRPMPGNPKPSVGTVWIYDPATDSMTEGASLPASRDRGAAGVAAYGGKIYVAGGVHAGVVVPWFDVYDPATDEWTELPDMPTARDHFQAQFVDDRFYAIGGRLGDLELPIGQNDAYDVGDGDWVTDLAPLPTSRSAYASAVIGDEIVVIGGETSEGSLDAVETYDVSNDTWRTLADMPTARHGMQAAVRDGAIYLAAGGTEAGGKAPTGVQEVFFPKSARPDALVKRETEALFVGDDIYSATAVGQRRSASVDPGGSAAFRLAVQNDAEIADTVRINGCTATATVGVAYELEGADVTADAIAGRVKLDLAPGEQRELRVELSVDAGAPSGITRRCDLAVASASQWTKLDVARVSVKTS